MTALTLNSSPSDLLSRFRGEIVDAVPGYPEVIHLRARDADGGEWRFSTFHAEYSPSDPDLLVGKVITQVAQEAAGRLAITFSDDSKFVVTASPLPPGDSGHDLETWHLITPDGLALWYGPRGRWQLSKATDVV